MIGTFSGWRAYVISALQCPFQIWIHIVMIQGHKQRVDNNAKRNKKFNKRIKNQERDVFLNLQPAPTAVPDAKHVYDLQGVFQHLLFQSRFFLLFFLLVLGWEIINSHCIKEKEAWGWHTLLWGKRFGARCDSATTILNRLGGYVKYFANCRFVSIQFSSIYKSLTQFV